MPLLNKATFAMAPVPLLSFEKQVFQIKFTGEIFATYLEYITRLQLYRHRAWTCEYTGTSGLTFEDALKSEKAARQTSQDTFPSVWRKLALNIVNYSMITSNLYIDSSSMTELTDFMVDYFRDHVIIGEIIYIGKDVGKIVAAIPIDTMQPRDANDSNVRQALKIENGDTPGSTPDIPSHTNGSILSQPLAATMYGEPGDAFKASIYKFQLHLLDEHMQIASTHELPSSAFRRFKNFNKANFKRFIKEVTIGEMFPGAPFVVKPQLVSVYKLTNSPSDKVRGLMEEARIAKLTQQQINADLKTRKRGLVNKPPQKFPIDDIDLLFIPRKQTGKDPAYPQINYDFGPVISEQSVEPLIQSYAFLATFASVISLSLFTFDDFLEAMTSPKSSALLNEVFGCCIFLATNRTEVYPIGERVEEQSTVFTNLSELDRVCIEQWFKWYPGRWATGYEGQRTPTFPSASRMKAWEVALVGYMRGCTLNIKDALVERMLAESDESMIGAFSDDGTSDLSDIEDIEVKRDDIIDALTDRIKRNFLKKITIEERIALLHHIINHALIDGETIHSYVDQCFEESARLKGEIKDISRERRQTEDLIAAQKSDEIAAEIHAEVLAIASDSREESVDVEMEDEASGSSLLLKTALRRSSHRVEDLLKKDKEDTVHNAREYQLFSNSKRGKKQNKERNDEKKRLEELERLLAKKEHVLHQRLYVVTAALTSNLLGHDRNFVKYYWFDADAGSVNNLGGGFDEYLNSYKNKPKAPAGIEWATGRIFVSTPATANTIDSGNQDVRWGYIDDPDDVDQLYKWLDKRGVRESKLLQHLHGVVEPLAIGMKKRHEDFEDNVPYYMIGRKRKAEIKYQGYLEYRNQMAK